MIVKKLDTFVKKLVILNKQTNKQTFGIKNGKEVRLLELPFIMKERWLNI